MESGRDGTGRKPSKWSLEELRRKSEKGKREEKYLKVIYLLTFRENLPEKDELCVRKTIIREFLPVF
ncbi:hypothetical protein NST74_02570 [Paenibacillus sp. FSL F4-0125]|uniref:hypothetical protein n=1 Tax=Paenibacillus sp. FSL F4-0125 TaxID=2954730 RepID=UPI0030FC6C29